MNENALRLKVARRKTGLTQRDCAHLIGVHQSTMSDYETGNATPGLREACLFSLIYGSPIEGLLPELVADVRRALVRRQGTLPQGSGRPLGRFNRQNTLNTLAGRLESLSRSGL